MIGSTLSIIIELIMVLLLVVTISYCFIVNSKLTALRTDQSGIRQVISELNRSSERAEKAISEMRRTALHVEGQIAGQMDAARHASEDLRQNLDKSKALQATLERFSDVDIETLQSMDKVLHPSSVSADQIEISKQLKRKRLGFGQDSFAPKSPLGTEQQVPEPQRTAQHPVEQMQGRPATLFTSSDQLSQQGMDETAPMAAPFRKTSS